MGGILDTSVFPPNSSLNMSATSGMKISRGFCSAIRLKS